MTQLTRMDDLLEMEKDEPEHSDVAEFFSGCNVLITDASDFINKLIIEKLLRCCPKIGRLFILVKPKLGITYKERLKSMFTDRLYERLAREQPDFKSRVTLIEGDTAESKLGLSSTSRDFLQKNTDVVIHKPATIRGDERLRRAVNINVRAVKLMLKLAAEMTNLKAFVHVSSAFSQYTNQYVNERFYKPRTSAEKVLSLLEVLDDNLLDVLSRNIIGRYPNANIFTQCLAEEVVQIYGKRLPTRIVRSPITLSTYKEPLCGYIDDSHEITKSLASVALGIVHVLHINGQCTAELVPADYVVSNILAAVWDIHQTWTDPNFKKMIGEVDPTIYNCVSSCQSAINWNTFIGLNKNLGNEEPSLMTIWYNYLVLVNHKWLYKVYKILLHFLPATIIDSFTRPKIQNLKFSTVYENIHKVNDALTYYGSKQWVFSNNNVLNLWNKMSIVDRKKFNFDITDLDWKEYTTYYTRGQRVYLFEDSMSSLRKARRKYNKLKVVHYALSATICFFFAYIVKVLA